MNVHLLKNYTHPHSRFMPIDGGLVHYTEEGTGEVIVLLHGIFSSLHIFDEWASVWKKDFRVIRLDLIGWGLTGAHPSQVYTVEKHMEIINTLLSRLGIDEFSIVGHSFGGWLAWEMAAKQPESVKKIALMCPAGVLNKKNVPLPFIVANIPVVKYFARWIHSKAAVKAFLNDVIYNKDHITEALVLSNYEINAQTEVQDAFLKFAQFDNHEDHIHLMPNIEAKTLLLWGEKDTWIPYHNTQVFQQHIKNIEFISLENIGHDIPDDAKDRAFLPIDEFLKT